MAIETKLKAIEHKRGLDLIKEDKIEIRKALVTTEFVYDGFLWVTKDGMSILDWLTYEVDTVLSASVLAPFVEKLVGLKADGRNDQMVRELSNQELIDLLSDIRFAKGIGDESIYPRVLKQHGFIVFDPSVQMERICYTVKTEMEYRMNE